MPAAPAIAAAGARADAQLRGSTMIVVSASGLSGSRSSGDEALEDGMIRSGGTDDAADLEQLVVECRPHAKRELSLRVRPAEPDAAVAAERDRAFDRRSVLELHDAAEHDLGAQLQTRAESGVPQG